MKPADTIFALSTPPGRSGIAVVRVSGPHAGTALITLGGRLPAPREAALALLTDPANGTALDNALVLWFPAPASFTGEDVAEFHLHGGRSVIAAVLEVLGKIAGLAAAEPGGFTRQAFGNGKLDLTEVEGLADLIDAETEAQRRMALRQMEGGLSGLYEAWRGELAGILAHVEATIDFADEEIPDGLNADNLVRIKNLAAAFSQHLDDGRRGERVRDGFRVVLAGPPNVGKSSLMNALTQRDVAIVSPEAGTTRDVIDVHLDLGGYPVQITDTAGIRKTESAIETEGVFRAVARATSADLVLWLRDVSDRAPPSVPANLLGGRDCDIVEVWTKIDLGDAPGHALGVSVKSGDGLGQLLAWLERKAKSQMAWVEDGMITRVRHRVAVEHARERLELILAGNDSAVELIAENLRAATHDLARLVGRVDVEDLLDVIFSDFCIGK